MKYCKNCGGQVEDGDLYCGYCGSKLSNETPYTNQCAKQDFDESTTSIDEDFHNEFDDEPVGDFNNNNVHDTKSGDINNSEFESYVEHRNLFGSYTETKRDGKRLKANKFAYDANTFGIISFIFGFFGGILGIIFGIIGLIKASKALSLCDTGEYDGKSKATNGKVLSIVGIVLSVFMMFFYISKFFYF